MKVMRRGHIFLELESIITHILYERGSLSCAFKSNTQHLLGNDCFRSDMYVSLHEWNEGSFHVPFFWVGERGGPFRESPTVEI